jgi:hypothetical protein
MRPFLSLLAAILVSLAAAAAGAAEAELPPAAKAALEKLDKSEGKLTADYKKSVAAERNKTIGELQKVMKDVTKTGDLDTANAVKAKVEELIAKNEADEDTDLLGNKKPPALAKQIVGTWAFQKTNGVAGTFEAFPDGRVVAAITAPLSFPAVPAKWEVKGTQVLLTWLGDATKVDTLSFVGANKLNGDTHDVGKNSFSATRQPPAK